MLNCNPMWLDGVDARDKVFANLHIGRVDLLAAAAFTQSNRDADASGESSGEEASLHLLIDTCYRTFTVEHCVTAIKPNAKSAWIIDVIYTAWFFFVSKQFQEALPSWHELMRDDWDPKQCDLYLPQQVALRSMDDACYYSMTRPWAEASCRFYGHHRWRSTYYDRRCSCN